MSSQPLTLFAILALASCNAILGIEGFPDSSTEIDATRSVPLEVLLS